MSNSASRLVVATAALATPRVKEHQGDASQRAAGNGERMQEMVALAERVFEFEHFGGQSRTLRGTG